MKRRQFIRRAATTAAVTGAIAVPLLAIELGYALTAGLAMTLYAVGLTVVIWTGD